MLRTQAGGKSPKARVHFDLFRIKARFFFRVAWCLNDQVFTSNRTTLVGISDCSAEVKSSHDDAGDCKGAGITIATGANKSWLPEIENASLILVNHCQNYYL